MEERKRQERQQERQPLSPGLPSSFTAKDRKGNPPLITVNWGDQEGKELIAWLSPGGVTSLDQLAAMDHEDNGCRLRSSHFTCQSSRYSPLLFKD